MGVASRGMRTTPFWGKCLKLTVKIRFTEKNLEIDSENPGFLRKRPPFKIQASPMREVREYVGLQPIHPAKLIYQRYS
jgi:hypothetical protein